MNTLKLLVSTAICLTFLPLHADDPWVLFSDNFNRTAEDPPGNNWTATGSGAASIAEFIDGGGSQKPNLLLEHAGSGLNLSLAQSAANFSDPNGWFDSRLSLSLGEVAWSFNMASYRSNVLRSMGDRGIATVLAASSADFNHTDTYGYAVVWGGNSDATLSLSLVWFDSGLQALGNNYTANQIISVDLNEAALRPFVVNNDTANGYAAFRDGFSIRASYTPGSNLWTLHARNDGLEGTFANFDNPAEGSVTLIGSATHSAYTADELNWMGFWGIDDTLQYSGAAIV